MTWFWILFCFVVALIIYFGKYYEEDKKAARDRSKRKDNGPEEFIFPLFQEHRDSHRDVHQSDPEDGENSDGEY
jgi:hypothetical protein